MMSKRVKGDNVSLQEEGISYANFLLQLGESGAAEVKQLEITLLEMRLEKLNDITKVRRRKSVSSSV